MGLHFVGSQTDHFDIHLFHKLFAGPFCGDYGRDRLYFFPNRVLQTIVIGFIVATTNTRSGSFQLGPLRPQSEKGPFFYLERLIARVFRKQHRIYVLVRVAKQPVTTDHV